MSDSRGFEVKNAADEATSAGLTPVKQCEPRSYDVVALADLEGEAYAKHRRALADAGSSCLRRSNGGKLDLGEVTFLGGYGGNEAKVHDHGNRDDSLRSIADAMTENGDDISPSTLRRYMHAWLAARHLPREDAERIGTTKLAQMYQVPAQALPDLAKKVVAENLSKSAVEAAVAAVKSGTRQPVPAGKPEHTQADAELQQAAEFKASVVRLAQGLECCSHGSELAAWARDTFDAICAREVR